MANPPHTSGGSHSWLVHLTPQGFTLMANPLTPQGFTLMANPLT